MKYTIWVRMTEEHIKTVSRSSNPDTLRTLHKTNWGTDDLDKNLTNTASMMAVKAKDGSFRFAEVQIKDENGNIIHQLQRQT